MRSLGKCLVFAGALAFSTQALASPSTYSLLTQKSSNTTKTGKRIVSEDVVVEDSSEYHRENKVASAVVELGFGAALTIGTGGAVGYYLTPNSLLELSYVAGSSDYLFIAIESALAELRWKKFWGNSFYTNLGLGYRDIGLKADLDLFNDPGSKINRTLGAQSLGVNLALGNRWQWENFTIGCDWLGLFVPISSTGDSEIKDQNVEPGDKEKMEDLVEDLGKATSSQFLRFYLGVSF
jgi:hypothetical protein